MKKLLFTVVMCLFSLSALGTPCDFYSAEQSVMTDDLQNLRSFNRSCENLTSMENASGQTLLHVASDFNAMESMRYLLDLGANPNVTDEKGMTSLFFAHSRSAAKMLLKEGADISRTDRYGRSAFSHVLETENYDVLEYLLDEGARVRVIDVTWAAEKYNLEALQFLARHAESREIRGSGKYFRTFFFHEKEYRLVAEKLIELGADLNRARTVSSRRSLLDFHVDEYASGETQSPKAIAWLARNGADVNGFMPRMGRTIFQALLTRTDFATNKNLTEVFLQNGLDINHASPNNRMKTALMELAFQQTETTQERTYVKKMTKYLLRKGANPNIQSESGRTALHWAVRWANVPAAKALQKTSNLSLTDDMGQTALDYARERLRRTPHTWEQKSLAQIIKLLQ